MSCFLDSNVPLASIFPFEPQHKLSQHILKKEYNNIYWSKNVINEFEKRFSKKREHLLKFYNDFFIEVTGSNKFYYSYHDLENFKNNYVFSNNKEKEDVLNSLSQFWNYYCENTDKTIKDYIIESLYDFINQLKFKIYKRKEFCENKIKYTGNIPKDENEFLKLFSLIEKEGCHYSDINIILDAYFFNKISNNDLDFVTFDKGCCKGALKLKLSFNNVKCLKDYDISNQ